MKEVTEKIALEKLAAWCAGSEHCESELINKMLRWGIDSASQCRIIEYLKENHFIDEERFCKAFVNDKFRFQKWGRKKITDQLRAKKVSANVIENALLSIDPREYMEALKSILKSKDETLCETDPYKRKSKLYRFALSRGFEPYVINQFIYLDGISEMD